MSQQIARKGCIEGKIDTEMTRERTVSGLENAQLGIISKNQESRVN
jgi:hypothetical protein